MKITRFLPTLALVLLLVPAASRADSTPARLDVSVDCKTPDAVGEKFCSSFKQKLRDSKNYRLVDSPSALGIGIHFSSIDMWQGINGQLLGRMSAMSVAFTIFADALPGEMYADSSVFRVGIDAVPDMTDKILAGLDQLVSLNAATLAELRAGNKARPAASPTTSP